MSLIVSLVAALLAAPPGSATPRCLVAGRPGHLAGVTVTPPGRAPFALDLDGVPLAATYGEGGSVTLAVEAPLAFIATAPQAALALHPRAGSAAAEGRVGLTARSRLAAVRAAGASLTVALDVDELVHADPFAVPCRALTFGDVDAERPTIVRPPEGRRLVPTGDAIGLRVAPDAAAPELGVRLGRGSTFMLERLAARGPWLRVAARWTDGTALRGWVEAARVEPLDADFVDLVSGVGRGECGWAVTDVYHGPARLRAGATVYDAPDGVAWARAPRAVEVTVIGRTGWVELADVPGLTDPEDCRLGHAVVHATDLVYPTR